MKIIFAIHFNEQPPFGPEAQHPDAVRYAVGNNFIDAVGYTEAAPPTQAEADIATGRTRPFSAVKPEEVAKIMQLREQFMNRMTNIALRFTLLKTAAGDTNAANCMAVNQAMADLFTDPGMSNATTVAELKTAFDLRYKAIVAMANTAVKNAFVALGKL